MQFKIDKGYHFEDNLFKIFKILISKKIYEGLEHTRSNIILSNVVA